MTGTIPIEVAILVLCIILSAFFSSAEAAFLSVQRTTSLAHLVKGGVPAARKVAEMLKEPGRLLSTILLGNNLVNVAFTAVITAVVLNEIDDQRTGLVIATATGTTILLILGSILFRWPLKSCGLIPTCIRDTGRMSAPSARSSRRTWMLPARCQSLISST